MMNRDVFTARFENADEVRERLNMVAKANGQKVGFLTKAILEAALDKLEAKQRRSKAAATK